MAKQRTRKNVAMVTIEAEVVLPDDPVLSANELLKVNETACTAAAMFPGRASASIKVTSRKALPPSEPVVEAPAKAA